MHFLIGDLKKNWHIVDLQYHVSFSCIAKWFSYVNSVFWWEGNFDSDESQFISFFPVCLVLSWLERNLLLPWGQEGFLLYFLPEGSGVYVYVPDPSRFYFCAELKVEVQFFSMPYPVVPAPSFIFYLFILLLLLFFYCSGFCHTLKWISHGFTCVLHPDPHSHLPLHPIPLGLPSAPGPSACLMHPTWAGDLFHPR